MGLFGSQPKWRHRDPSIRKAAVAELSDADSLMDVLRVEEDADIARIAAARIVNLGRADLLVENLDARRITTIPAIQATLARLENLQKEIEEEERRRTTRETADPAALLQIIRQTNDLDVAMAALSRIEDQRALVKVLRGSTFTRVMDAARERITDPSVLREMVGDSDVDLPERRAALRRVSDPAFHESVAMNDGFPHAMQLAALELIQDSAALGRVALTSRNSSLRHEALERADDEVRAQIAMSDPDATRRWAAADRIRDPAILERLALSASDAAVRQTAARRQQDAGTVERLSRAGDPGVREAAVSGLRDPVLLRRLLEEERHEGIRGAIAARLLDDDVLLEQTRSDSADERRSAVSRLRDRSALEAIAGSDSELALEAGERLKKINDVEDEIAELERRIERLKQLPDYRHDLEWKVSGDSQTFEAYMLSAGGRESPLRQVERLEAEISSLRRTLG